MRRAKVLRNKLIDCAIGIGVMVGLVLLLSLPSTIENLMGWL